MTLGNLVENLLDACVELRKEVSELPAEERAQGEWWRFEVLEEIRGRCPSPNEVRSCMLARAQSAHGGELASWLERMFRRFERQRELIAPVGSRR
jgi:hypothetical protein